MRTFSTRFDSFFFSWFSSLSFSRKTGETPWLNGKHVVFGKVTKGMDVVSAINAKGTEMGKPKAEIEITDCGTL
jgi:cyclophilin family peptidyl-prolyl cis-trans isomerase